MKLHVHTGNKERRFFLLTQVLALHKFLSRYLTHYFNLQRRKVSLTTTNGIDSLNTLLLELDTVQRRKQL